jgi:protease II
MPALPPYPANPQVPLVEDHFGQKVSDPWRWLEADVRTDAKVAAWVQAQSAYTAAYLKQLPERPALEKADEGADRLRTLRPAGAARGQSVLYLEQRTDEPVATAGAPG